MHCQKLNYHMFATNIRTLSSDQNYSRISSNRSPRLVWEQCRHTPGFYYRPSLNLRPSFY